MADGEVIIDTKLDQSGFEKGLASMGKTAAAGLATVIAALGTVTVAAANAGIEFESAFAGVKKTVDATKEELEDLRSGILKMSTEIPIAASEIAGIAEAAGQLGIQTENILDFTRTMADLGVATNMTSEEAATSLARLANITGMSQTEFSNLGSTIVALGNNLATTESEIVNMALRLAGTGAQVGMTEDQILSLAAAASSVGLEAEAGGSAFSRVMSMMQLASEQGGASLKAFADVAGMSASDFAHAFQTDAAGALTAFIEGLSRAEESGQSAISVIAEMGEISELSALDTITVRDTLLRASGASDVFTEALEIGSEAWVNNTALTKEASQRYETMESKIQLLKNSLTSLGIAAYEDLKGPMGDIVTMATDMVSQLNDAFSTGGLSGLVGEIGAVLADVVSEVVAYTPKIIDAAVSVIDSFVSGIREAIPALAPAAVEICTALADGILTIIPEFIILGMELFTALVEGVAAAAPTLITAFTTALGGLFMALTEQLPLLLQAGMTLLQSICDGIIQALPIIIETAPAIIQSLCANISAQLPSLLTSALEIITTLASAIVTYAPQLITAAVAIVTDIASFIIANLPMIAEAAINIIMQLAETLIDSIPDLLDAVVEIMEGLLGFVVDNLQFIAEAAVEIVTQLCTKLVELIPELVPVVTNIIMSFFNFVVQNLPTIVQSAIQIMLTLVQGIIAQIPTLIPAVIEIIGQIFSSIVANLPMIIAGAIQIITTLAMGLIQAIPHVIAAIPQIISAIVDGFLNTDWASVGSGIISGIGAGIANAARGLVNIAVSAARNALNAVKSWLGINSPSRRAKIEIGKWILPGVGEGVEESEPELNEQMETAADNMITSFADRTRDIDVPGLVAKMKAGVDREVGSISADVTVRTKGGSGRGDSIPSENIDYNRLGAAVVRALIQADVKVECDDREFGRLISDHLPL